ncbi:MAG: cytidylate kinase [Crocinitomicaceae bacterium]|nr:cytidylate kinase [Crocinitomicaceae bacterium]|tara:strand:- start:9594 stop:10289 length:696 start_codon:yes stop_codon:yes gene_type:complete
MATRRITIAIDGHSSAGKSTMAKALAKELNYVYIDTGAMYRAATLYAIKERLILNSQVDMESIGENLDRMFLSFKFNPATERPDMHLDGVNVEKEIRTLEVAKNVSFIAKIPEVRKKLVALQKRMAEGSGVVMDGRDIGTVVLPDAELKFFMTADPEVRAWRRLKEIKDKERDTTFDEVLENVLHRDKLDSERAVAPLKQAHDAVIIDNSNLSMEEQFEFMLKIALKRMEI